MFPQLIAGPIVRYETINDELDNRKQTFNDFSSGISRFIIGLSKKVLIANILGELCNIFILSNEKTVLFYWIYGISYSLQIYFDFSAYSDMAIGLGRMFGFHFMENFDYPYISKSITEFWRRWHITLGTWLKEYIFYPISLSKLNMKLNLKLRKMKSKYISRFIITAFPLFFVWFFNGMWHGASFKYVVYGLYYYVLMMIGILLEPVFKKIISIFKINTEVWSYKFFQAIRTILIVCFGMFLFRVDSFKQMGLMIHSNASASLFSLGLKKLDFALLMVGILVMLVVGVMQEFNINIRKELQKQNLLFKWFIYYIIIFSVIIFGIYGKGYDAASFIYGGF